MSDERTVNMGIPTLDSAAVARPERTLEDELGWNSYYERADIKAQIEQLDRAKQSLEAEEKALALFEQNYNDERTRAQRWEWQEYLQGGYDKARRVNVLHCHEFIRRLARAGVAATIYYMPQYPYRVWLNDFSRVKRIGVNGWYKNRETGRLEARTITTLHYPYSYEWSVMRFNEYNVPTNERFRGWRTALLALIEKEIITEEEAVRAFGQPIGEAGILYRLRLSQHRNKQLGIVAA